MTTIQWLGVTLLFVTFFGSLALGRYFRWQDEKQDARLKEPSRIVVMMDDPQLDDEFFYSAHDPDKLLEYMEEYFGEIERIARGFHNRAVHDGEDVAEQWLREQIGQGP